MAAKKKPSQAYRGNGKHSWEDVAKFENGVKNGTTSRLRVPGGWLYSVAHGPSFADGESVVFVPMPGVVKHEV